MGGVPSHFRGISLNRRAVRSRPFLVEDRSRSVVGQCTDAARVPAKFAKPSSDGTMISFLRFRFCARARQVGEALIMRVWRSRAFQSFSTHALSRLPLSRPPLSRWARGCRLPRLLAQVPSDHRSVARRVALPWCVFHIFSSIGCDSRAHVVRDRPAAGTWHRG
jgi:hypothetical protein